MKSAEKAQIESRIDTSNSVSNTYCTTGSYQIAKNPLDKETPQEKNRLTNGMKNRRIPAQKINTSGFKKKNRKAFTTAKKKLGSAQIDSYTENSISPTIKLKKGYKQKSVPMDHPQSANLSRVKSGEDSANTSFTLDGNKSASFGGKNLIDEFNQKYNPNDSDKSEDEKSKEDSVLNENVAIIHVIDETKRRKQDFKCSINKLLKHMKYFENSINGCEDKIGLDISVHCDLDTFEWLIKYIHLDKQIIHKN